MGFFKISQGVWAGENYAGGRIITPNDDSDGKLFARLWQTVKPVSFLDRIAHNHDLGYEYAERAYGDKRHKGTDHGFVSRSNACSYA